MKSEKTQTPLIMPVGLAAHLLVSHLTAAFLAYVIGKGEFTTVQGVPALFVGIAAGMVLTIPLQYTIRQVGCALRKLNGDQFIPEVSPRWYGPLADLAVQINMLAKRINEVTALREGLLHQARESAAQQERNRLARDLHDSIKQQIFSISTSAAAAQARWDHDPDGAHKALADVRSSAQEAMVEMNALLQQLSPALLEKVGLVQALHDQCEALSHRTEAEVSIEFGPLPDDTLLPPGAQESLFRIAQEALSNIARHARAGRVNLYLGQRLSGGPMTLEITDDGQGFDRSEVRDGMGLSNIRQRVLTLGGELSIESLPGEGTTLRVVLPLTELVQFREEVFSTEPDHRLNKTFLAGLGGGLALIAVLIYPLYILMPGRFIESWGTDYKPAGTFLEITAVLIAISTGFLAAKWVKTVTRQSGALIGALAGGAAASIMYFGLGASAAGLIGSGFLFDHGLSSDTSIVYLVAGSSPGLVWWLSAAFWVALLSGIGLGSVGGILVPLTIESVPPHSLKLRMPGIIILTITALVSGVLLVFSSSTFPLLESRINSLPAGPGILPGTSLPLQGISLWTIGTPAVFYFTSLISNILLLHKETQTDNLPGLNSGRAISITLGLLSLIVSILLLIIKTNLEITYPAQNLVYAAIVSLSFTIGGLYVFFFIRVNHRRQQLFPAPPNPVRASAAGGIVLSIACILWALNQPFIVSITACLVIIAADTFLVIRLRRQATKAAPDILVSRNTRLDMPSVLAASIGTGFAFIIPAMANTSVMAALRVYLAAAFEIVSEPQPDLARLVRTAYSTQAQVCLFVFIAATIGVGLSILFASGISSITNRSPSPKERDNHDDKHDSGSTSIIRSGDNSHV
ncbi:MAG: sensor histidine kinase [Anaerolineales bacterium]|nr:sensor histidine kinase [Anaerolineales bacterium]